jgi:prephenate dehydratase
VKVLYAGETGSFSQKACLQFFGPDIEHTHCASFREVFKAVDEGAATLGIVPVENSQTGSIHENYDLLLEYDLRIVGEITLRIRHNLLGNERSSVSDIQRVYSHPQVFQQCRDYLSEHPTLDLVACKDTASAVQRIKESGETAEAAIASKEAAQLFHMKILEEGIETNPRNFTRFVVISRDDFLEGPRNKSSIIFSVSDQPGSLCELLKMFAENHINLVKLESRPIDTRPWEYLFYADVEIDIFDERFSAILEELRGKTEFLKLLGSYPKGSAQPE